MNIDPVVRDKIIHNNGDNQQYRLVSQMHSSNSSYFFLLLIKLLSF